MTRIYDGRPAPDALAARMRRDRVSGEVRAIVHQEGTIDEVWNGRDVVPRRSYLLVTTGVFDADGAMVAHYATRRDGRIKGARRTDHCWGWMVPREGAFRIATESDLAALRPTDGAADAADGAAPSADTGGAPRPG